MTEGMKTIPDGKYEGVWGGYHLDMHIGDQVIPVRTELGVRGLNVPVTFVWKDGKVLEKTIKVKKGL